MRSLENLSNPEPDISCPRILTVQEVRSSPRIQIHQTFEIACCSALDPPVSRNWLQQVPFRHIIENQPYTKDTHIDPNLSGSPLVGLNLL